MRISISTLSKSFNLSDEALRYYERRNLLQPERLNDSRYRVFNRVDIQRVGNIKRLQNQGFQLDEIREIYDGISQDDMLDLMDEKRREMDWDIRYKLLICERMSESVASVRRFIRFGDAPETVREKPFYLRIYPSIEELWNHVSDDEDLTRMFCNLPLSSFTTIFPYSALLDPANMQSPQKGVLIGAEAAELLGIDIMRDFRRIDATRAVSCVLQLENGQFELDGVAVKILNFLEEHDLSPADDLFTHQIMNFRDSDGIHRHYTQLILPVNPN
ncbi:MAG: MerR family transcriptional regulator [Clostridia bacterium]|nr:MerR family transcriptional regulator [Clostridia bacterium]